MTDFRLYRGDGRSTLASRDLTVPEYAELSPMLDPAAYLADDGLRDAVNVALALGQPLLVTGEPGTGKTMLAASVAHELGLAPALSFFAKTTSSAKDLFYRYDALGHFHDAQFRREKVEPDAYITYEALGIAILRTMSGTPSIPAEFAGSQPRRSVVLIDEIDKAPRDLPNDVLNELESMSFTVRETGRTYRAEARHRPIVVFTSNSEKSLPDAFLRRCVFYHIAFPDRAKLVEIIERRLRFENGFTPTMVRNAVEHFEEIRQLGLRKNPATAELLGWLQILSRQSIDPKNLKPGQAEALAFSYSILAKTREDRDRLQEFLRR